jgi:hypothetical protein
MLNLHWCRCHLCTPYLTPCFYYKAADDKGGLCRKKLNLIPTGQVKSKAAQDGFDNVHDWLVFQATGESSAALSARKEAAPWLSKLLGSAPQGKARSDPSGAAEERRNSEAEAKDQQVVGKKRKRASNGSKGVTTCVDAVHNAISRGVPPVTPNSAAAGVVCHPCGCFSMSAFLEHGFLGTHKSDRWYFECMLR